MTQVKSPDIDSSLEARFLRAFEVNRPHILNGRGQSLAEMRNRAIREFADIGFPGPKDEAWKYTRVSKVLARDYEVTVSPTVPALARTDIEPFLIENLDAHTAVLVNGVFVPELSSIDPVKMRVTDLLESADDPVFLEHFGRRTDEQKEVFASLNTAFARHGLFVHVPKGAGGRTLHVINISTEGTDVFLQPRHLFIVEDEAELTVIETHVGSGERHSFTNAVAECFVGERGRLDYYRIQDDECSSSVTNTFVYQKASSYSSCTTVTLAGETIRNNVNVLPDAGFCESHLIGLFICKDDMHVDNHTLVDHAKPDCFSNELYKGILSDQSTGVFNGKVLVRRDAQRTNAYQSSKSVVLGDSARMNAKPELEIYADDVKCSHGATTGRLDAEALFYLRTRGLSEQRARTILLLAFARDVLENIQISPLREMLDSRVENRLT